MPQKHNSEKIVDWKRRRRKRRSGIAPISEVHATRLAWAKNSEELKLFSDFIPVRLVTLIEVFVREAVQDLVDRGTPFVERAEPLVKGTKIDFVFANSIQGKLISLGDIVAHSISLNSFSQVLTVFEILFPGFRGGIAAVHDRWVTEIEGKPQTPIIGNIDKLCSTLVRLFELRHIIVHELPVEKPYAVSELSDFIRISNEFIEATDWFIRETLDKDSPLTQTDMNISASASLEMAEKELEAQLKALDHLKVFESTILMKNQARWSEFANSIAELEASQVEGGSMYPLVYSSSREYAVRERIEQVKKWINGEEGEVFA